MEAQPQRRHDGIVFDRLDDGAVIYDSHTGQAHSLDSIATRVLTAADGQHSPAEVAAEVGVDEASVHATLEALQARGLLQQTRSVSRREMLKRTAIVGAAATAAAAVIETVVIPTPEAHASVIAVPGGPTIV